MRRIEPALESLITSLKTRMAARNRPTCDGMRRCQRLPELTHPVDSARPTFVTSNPVPAQIVRKGEKQCGRGVLSRGRAVTSRPDDADTTFCRTAASLLGTYDRFVGPVHASGIRLQEVLRCVDGKRLPGRRHCWQQQERSGAAIGPTVHGQTAAVRRETPRVVQFSGGGSWIGLSVRDLGDEDVAKTKLPAPGGVLVEEVSTETARRRRQASRRAT